MDRKAPPSAIPDLSGSLSGVSETPLFTHISAMGDVMNLAGC